MRRTPLLLIPMVVSVAVGITCPADAQDKGALSRVYLDQLRPGRSSGQFVDAVMAQFRVHALGGPILTQAMVDKDHAMLSRGLMAFRKAMFVTLDADKDRRVTEAEARSLARLRFNEVRESNSNERKIEGFVANVMVDDADGDGVVDEEEYRRGSEARVRRVLRDEAISDKYLALAPDGQELTEGAMREMATATFARIDADGDGVLSQGEIDAVRPPGR